MTPASSLSASRWWLPTDRFLPLSRLWTRSYFPGTLQARAGGLDASPSLIKHLDAGRLLLSLLSATAEHLHFPGDFCSHGSLPIQFPVPVASPHPCALIEPTRSISLRRNRLHDSISFAAGCHGRHEPLTVAKPLQSTSHPLI